MAARRGHGEGSVYRVDGGWTAVLDLPRGPDGKRNRRRRRAKTKAEALDKLREMQAEVSANGEIADRDRRVSATLADFYKVREAKQIARRTLELDRWMLGVIEDVLGKKRIVDLSVADVDHFLAVAAEGRNGRPIGRSSLRRIRSTLVAAVKNDMRLGLVNRNVADLSVMPSGLGEKSERRALTIDELNRICEAATGTTAILVDLIGRNGLRPSEARAMRWKFVDLEAMTMTIRAQLSNKAEFVEPKTRKAYRTIRIDEITADKFRRWHERQEAQRAAAGHYWQNLDLIAATSSGLPVQRHNLGRSIRALCARLSIDPLITPYELRHTAISIQAEAGHPAFQIADWAGTSERMISDVYRHQLTELSELGPANSGC